MGYYNRIYGRFQRANILVEIFSDRVEITNPGGMVNGLTIEDLGRRSLSGNPLLCGLMQRVELIEKVGSGIARMRNAMESYGLKSPVFDINENWFTIIFMRSGETFAKTTLKTTRKTTRKTVDKIIVEIQQNPYISRKEIADIVGISENGVKCHLNNLKKKGILVRTGPNRVGKWIIKDDADRDK
ncbi:MAG: winged helix-turn-helix transcriptional regulator [Methanogenium sp.]|nr:winged helix-turn-helix transcriptional regulator [Methanogenium sp.]